MDFLIKCPKRINTFSQCEIKLEHWEKPIEIEFISKNRLIILGDIVYPSGQSKEKIIDCFDRVEIFEVIGKLGGHFYLFFWRDDISTLEVYTSYGSLLPIYYTENNGYLISSNVEMILNAQISSWNISKEFIIERLLFNYHLTEISIFEEIKRLKSNHCLLISERIVSHQYFDNINLLNYEKKFVSNDLIELFSENTKKYAPSENFFLSFTGGFDGRTLLAVLCENYKDIMQTYSFGRLDSSDVVIPQNQANILGIKYHPFNLFSDEYINQAFDLGNEFVMSSSAEANFTRAHYLWACSKINKEAKYILSGNFGSEMMRSPHFTGIQFSDILYKVITGVPDKRIIEDIYSTELKFILPENGRTLLLNIFERINDSSWAKFKTKDLNKKYYYFILNEGLRKYFGPEIKSQTNYLYNRTPYYDFNFIVELFKSKYSGLNSKFFEQNKIKRFKGQLLYANIIKETNKNLLYMSTGKGYKPIDLLSNLGKFKIAYSKIISHKKEVPDPFATSYLFDKNYDRYSQNIDNIRELGFRTENFDQFNDTHKATLFSIGLYINKLINK